MKKKSCLNCKHCVWSGVWEEIECSDKTCECSDKSCECSDKTCRRMFGRCDYQTVPAVFSLNNKIYHDEGRDIAGSEDCPCWESKKKSFKTGMSFEFEL